MSKTVTERKKNNVKLNKLNIDVKEFVFIIIKQLQKHLRGHRDRMVDGCKTT